MAITTLTTQQFGGVQRDDVDITTTTQALITKAVQGTGISLSSTGVDAGTGDVTINVDINGLTEDVTPVSSTDYVVTYDASATTLKKVKISNLPTGTPTIAHTIGITVDGAGAVVTTGTKGRTQVNFAGTLVGITLLAKESGTVRFGISKGTFSDFPSSMTSIVGANKPELSSAQKAEITLDGGYTTSIAVGDTLVFGIDAGVTPVTITQVTLLLHYEE